MSQDVLIAKIREADLSEERAAAIIEAYEKEKRQWTCFDPYFEKLRRTIGAARSFLHGGHADRLT